MGWKLKTLSFVLLAVALVSSASFAMDSVKIELLTESPLYLDTVPSSAELSKRRQALAALLVDGLVLIDATAKKTTLARPNFYYLTGIELGSARLLLRIKDGQLLQSVLFLPARDRFYELWNGWRPFPGEWVQVKTGMDQVLSLAKYDSLLDELKVGVDNIWLGAEQMPARRRLTAKLLEAHKANFGERSLKRVESEIFRLRAVKSAFEIELLKQAIRSTHYGFQAALGSCTPGRYEFQVEARMEAAFMERGSRAPGFDSIIGSGPNSCVLHYTSSRRQIKPGELLLMDVGAQCGAYTADITRTIPVDGKYSARQLEIYRHVLEAQRLAIAEVKAGVTLRQLTKVARDYFKTQGLDREFKHGIGHHIGLEVHDVSVDQELRVGAVITIEPGLYLEEEAIGIRIEDMVLVTTGGSELLSKAIPKQPEQVERWLAKVRSAAKK